MIEYRLPGSRHYLDRLHPDPAHLDPATKSKFGLDTPAAVIAHFIASSLAEDGILIGNGSLTVKINGTPEGYVVAFDPQPQHQAAAEQFAARHAVMLDAEHAGLALAGADACKRTPAWNPMAGYPVNRNDGPSEWLPCLPLGMPIVNHRAVTLMHYPPMVAYKTCDYLNNMTLHRWARLLQCVGIDAPQRYHNIVDVNPIAAPGSGESEYANDYFPINLTSMFFDDEARGLTYLRSMLELMLNPEANAASATTLPLLVCGAPLYDPQAPGWFRTRYKELLPKDKNGSPMVATLQAGLVRINPDSAKLTPYLIANHMIAAGVTGRCTNDPTQMPDIRLYEAQDLAAASFLALCGQATLQGQEIDPAALRSAAVQRWFDDKGAPIPPAAEDKLLLCAMAQMDMFTDWNTMAPKYSLEEAKARCREQGSVSVSPCFGGG